jgi:two-component system OmpR family sensor kinase
MVGEPRRVPVSDSPDDVRDTRWGQRLFADVLGVALGCAALWALLGTEQGLGALPAGMSQQLLALAAAAVGGGTAILAVLSARLGDERGASWFGAAMVGYGVLLPWAVLAPAPVPPTDRVSRLVAELVVLALLVLSVWPPRRPCVGLSWVLLGVGAVLAVALRWLPVDGALRGLTDGPLPGALLLAGWAVAAAGRVAHGVRRHRPASLRIGLGLVVLAAAQLVPLAGRPAGMSDLMAAGLRLLGLVIVLVGLAQGALAAWRGLQVQQQEVLAAAALHQQRTDELVAERDHELRNGLAGLAGITHLLSSDGPEHEPLKHAVLAELGRLHLILNGPLGDPEEPDRAEPATDYLVEPVLSGLVTLRRHGGDRVRLRVEPGLRAHGHSTVLAQVVTNLLANCDRHAPGTTVTVEARRSGGMVVVGVRDRGPGLSGRVSGSVLDRGTRDESAGGSGLGLHISRQLLAREGGALTLRTVEDPQGCLAIVTLPPAGVKRAAEAGSAPAGHRPAGDTARPSR